MEINNDNIYNYNEKKKQKILNIDGNFLYREMYLNNLIKYANFVQHKTDQWLLVKLVFQSMFFILFIYYLLIMYLLCNVFIYI